MFQGKGVGIQEDGMNHWEAGSMFSRQSTFTKGENYEEFDK
jgi:hypothetical protein